MNDHNLLIAILTVMLWMGFVIIAELIIIANEIYDVLEIMKRELSPKKK